MPWIKFLFMAYFFGLIQGNLPFLVKNNRKNQKKTLKIIKISQNFIKKQINFI